MSNADQDPSEPGWYMSPGEPGIKRYWDGVAWTERVVRVPSANTGDPSGTAAGDPSGQPLSDVLPVAGESHGGRVAVAARTPVAGVATKPSRKSSRLPFLLGGVMALAVVAGVALLVGPCSGSDDSAVLGASVTRAPADTGGSPSAVSTTPAGGAPSTAAAGGATSSAPRSATAIPGTARNPIPMGQSNILVPYVVRVHAFRPDATAQLQGGSGPGGSPANGRYAQVSVDATYQGNGQGHIAKDLRVALNGGDGVQYLGTDCATITRGAAVVVPPLPKGETAARTFCFDVPKAALAKASLSVDELQSTGAGDDAVYWALR